MNPLWDVLEHGKPCVIKNRHGQDFYFDGTTVFTNKEYSEPCNLTVSFFEHAWKVVEPTVDDVLKERGYRFVDEWGHIRGTWVVKKDICILWLKSKPETVAELTRIIDFMETLK